MALDYGIKIAAPGKDARTATGTDLLLNLSSPLAKLDSTNKISFQNILIFFSHEPPNGTGVPVTTLVYSFPHGYSYIPHTWFLYQNTNGSSSSSAFTYGQERSVIYAPSVNNNAQLLITTDKTNVNIYVVKTYDNSGSNIPNIAGYQIKLRAYVFVESIATS